MKGPETGLWGWHLTSNSALIPAKDLQDSSSPRTRPGGSMNDTFKPNRWIPCAALIVFSIAVSRNLPAQAPTPANAPSPSPAAVPSASGPATAAPRQPTDEEIGDSLTAHQRYQAAIAAYAKAPEMTADIWNKMGIDYQMMFNSADASRCYKESLKLDPRNPQVLNNLGTVYASSKDLRRGRPPVPQGTQNRSSIRADSQESGHQPVSGAQVRQGLGSLPAGFGH